MGLGKSYKPNLTLKLSLFLIIDDYSVFVISLELNLPKNLQNVFDLVCFLRRNMDVTIEPTISQKPAICGMGEEL